MSELLYKDEVFKLVGFCMEIHRELGKGHDEIIYKDALAVELQRSQISFVRELKYEINYKGVVLPHSYNADFVVWNKILFEGKAAENLTDAHVKQVLNYLAASKLELGLLVNFGSDSLEWKRVVLSGQSRNRCRRIFVYEPHSFFVFNSRQFAKFV
jgi:GxxExxY protein